jgi:hypothetical protein
VILLPAAVLCIDMPSPALDIESLRGAMTDYVADVNYKEDDPRAGEIVSTLNIIAGAADGATKRENNKWFEVHFLTQHLTKTDVTDIWNAIGAKHLQYVDMVTPTLFGDLHVAFMYLREPTPIKCKDKIYSVSWKAGKTGSVPDGSVVAETNLMCDGYITEGAFIDLVKTKVFRDGSSAREVTYSDITPPTAAKRQNS